MSEPLRIAAIGDSLIYGRHDSAGGWVGRTRLAIEAIDEWAAVFNLGIGGETSEDVSKRLKQEIEPRKPNFILIGVGANDARRHRGHLAVKPAAFERNLKRLLKDAQGMAETVAIATLLPYCEALEDPNDTYQHKNSDARQYYEIQRAQGVKKKCVLFDFWPIIERAGRSVYSDIVHLRPEGHQLLADEALRTLRAAGYMSN